MELSFGMDPEDRERELFTENSAQALLIASLREDVAKWQRLQEAALTLVEVQERRHARELSDTQRQNAEQAEQIAELVEYANGLREALDEIIDDTANATAFDAISKPMPKAMEEHD